MTPLIQWLAFFATALTGIGSPIGHCDPIDGPKLEWTRAERMEAREMARDYLKATGAEPVFLAFADSAAVRESSGAASRRHDENTGLGMHGLNVRYFGKGRNLCNPVESAEAVRGIAGRAITKYGAKTAWDVHAVFSGRIECVTGKGECTGAMQDRTTSAICSRMAHRGFDCHTPIRESDLGLSN